MLMADGKGSICWWVDVSCAVHPDLRVTPGPPCPWVKDQSTVGHGNNGWSLRVLTTESKVIGVYDILPCTTQFLQVQGMVMEKIMIYQDNMSWILLEKNG